MVKKRLMGWDIRKTYRRAEKQRLLHKLHDEGEASVQRTLLHGKLVDMHRIRRFECDERTRRRHTYSAGASGMRHKPCTPSLQSHDRIECGVLPQPSELPALEPPNVEAFYRYEVQIEFMVFLIYQLWDAVLVTQFERLHHTDRSKTEGRRFKHAADEPYSLVWSSSVWLSFARALSHLREESQPVQNAFVEFDFACGEVSRGLSLERQIWSDDDLAQRARGAACALPFGDIIEQFCDPTWMAYDEVFDRISGFLYNMSAAHHGTSHPMTSLWITSRIPRRCVGQVTHYGRD